MGAKRLGPLPIGLRVSAVPQGPVSRANHKMSKNLNASETPEQNRSGLGWPMAGLFFLLAAASVNAQQINGVPGSPGMDQLYQPKTFV